MTVWSIPLRGIRGKTPRFKLMDDLFPDKANGEDWKKAYIHDSRPIVDEVWGTEIHIPTLQGISINHYEYKGDDISAKLSGEYDFAHMMPHLPAIFSEIVIDDSYWKAPYMPDYPHHNDSEKYSTINSQSGTLITALRLIGFNRCIAPFFLKNSTLKNALNCEDGEIELMMNHPFQIPMAAFPPDKSKSRITQNELQWIGRAMRTMNRLFYEEKNDFTATMTAMNYYYGDIPVRAKMTIIWAGIEDLLRPKGSVRFGVRSRAAMILGRTNDEIEEYFSFVGKLYDKRNSASHGKRFAWTHGIEDILKNEDAQLDLLALMDSYQLLCDIFYCIVDRGNRFSDEELLSLEEQYKEMFPE